MPRLVDLLGAVSLVILSTIAGAGEPVKATVYKNPQCGCCAKYAEYLAANGFDVQVVAAEDLAPIRWIYQVPAPLEGCHATEIGRYLIEGHVPVAAIARLLNEKPATAGISLPGMPEGSPGMSGVKSAPFTIYEIGGTSGSVFVTE